MSRPVANQRLFVAVHPPHASVLALLAELDTLDGLPEHRPTPREQVHLTLQFIGDVAMKDLERVGESVERSAAGVGAFELRPLRLITLPAHGPARLVACETDSPPELLELHRRLAHRLARSTRERDAAEGYLPHVTLCRFRRPVPVRAIEAPLDLAPYPVDRIRLMRSVLRADGTEHAMVHQYPLAPRGEARA